ncbi:MAG: hypothetical protein ACRCYU_17910 [Nocardioides sp.]
MTIEVEPVLVSLLEFEEWLGHLAVGDLAVFVDVEDFVEGPVYVPPRLIPCVPVQLVWVAAHVEGGCQQCGGAVEFVLALGDSGVEEVLFAA